MNNVVTNNTSTYQTQSPVSPVKNTSNESVKTEDMTNQPVGNKQDVAAVTRQDPASSESADKVKEQLTEIVGQLNDFVQKTQRDLNFSVDEVSGKTVVTVLDTTSQEVIRQIPSEEALERLHIFENIQGLLFKDQA